MSSTYRVIAIISLLVILCGFCEGLNKAALGFKDLPWDDEKHLNDIPIKGVIPNWVKGTIFRNGPARFLAPENDSYGMHWFNGLGMIHAFSIADGKVSYTNQFIRSTIYNQSKPQDPCPILFEKVQAAWSSNSLVTIRKVDTSYISNTALTVSNEFDPVTLNTISAPFEYNDNIGIHYAPEHAHLDPFSGEVVHFISFGLMQEANASYQIYSIPPNSKTRKPIGTVNVNPKVGVPLYQHSFSLTPNYVVMSEIPVEFADHFYQYKYMPSLGTTWRVISRKTGMEVANFTSDAFFMFHHINAYENHKKEPVVELVTFPDNSILDALYLNEILNHTSVTVDAGRTSRAMRYVLPMDSPGSKVVGTVLSQTNLELPTINPAFNTQPNRYIYGIHLLNKKSEFWDALVKIDTKTGELIYWKQEDCFPGEPLFVAAPDTNREDGGLLISVVLDSKSKTSFLLVLQAETLKVVARAFLPNAYMPFGFHGRFYDLNN